MNWQELLNQQRLCRPDAIQQEGRTAFQQDIDRIVFSASFRRLAHKTQVHPLSQNDHVHTRLTHSVEVASVGRSLGTIVGTEIVKSMPEGQLHPSSFGDVVTAACLAHDIGNPPFGHAGEEAIQGWFSCGRADELELTPAELSDFQRFDGNAQGFRILTNLENRRFDGGLQLTYATLGAFTKYPRAYTGDFTTNKAKIGILQAELPYFRIVAGTLGLPASVAGFAWARHPLAHLLEAADDICYSIIDIEDGFVLGYLDYQDAVALLEPIAEARFPEMDRNDQIPKLRAVAIGNLVRECSAAFLNNLTPILAGDWPNELLEKTRLAEEVRSAKTAAREKIYWSITKAKLEIAGKEIIWGLLDIFSNIAVELQHHKFDHESLSSDAQRLARLHGTEFRRIQSTYQAMLSITDTISGMTDRYALDLYRSLRGISLLP